MRINLIGAGGCGCNIVAYLKANLDTKHRSEFRDLYIDTSTNNATSEALAENRFHHIKSMDVEGNKLSGSGGERITNFQHIKLGVNEFINTLKLHQNHDLNIVVFSLSGGTGSVAAPVIIDNLLATGANVIGLVVADSTNFQFIHNSERTIVTLNTIAKKRAALPLMYFNNKVYRTNNEIDKIKACNRDVLSVISTLSIFTSGENKDIDDKDMELMFKPHLYSALNISNGIYGISAGVCELTERELKDKNVILGRTLVATEDEGLAISPLSNYPLLQYKEGLTEAEIAGHIDIMISDNLSELYDSLVADKEAFINREVISSIPEAEDDIMAF